ncbi:MAG: efflux RND transporter permease subunit, partial [Pseudomonadota bacterium]
MKGPNWRSPEELAAIPLATPLGGVQTLGNLTRIRRTVGPTQLLRVDGARTVTLSVLPPPAMTVEEALDVLRDEVGPLVAEGLPDDVSLSYRGTADRLEAAMQQMSRNIVLAVLILFGIMAALFRSVRDSLLVLAVMPLALAGGILSLNALNLVTVQSLDLLTMIGFIILLGLIVNNAILLVMQTRVAERNSLARAEAVEQAVRLRARPIYMSTATSLFGMLPLALIPGVGSEIYRGLAVVIIGGLAVSALFSLIFIPALLKLELPALGRQRAAARVPGAAS